MDPIIFPTEEFLAETIRNYEPYNKTLSFMRDIFKEYRVVLAGGCLRDVYAWGNFEKVKDVDVFVLGVDEGNDYDLVRRVYDAMIKLHPTDAWSKFLVRETRYLAAQNVHRLWVDMKLPWLYRKTCDGIHLEESNTAVVEKEWIEYIPVQIVFASETSPNELLKNFDWQICGFSYDGKEILAPGFKDCREKTLTLGNHAINLPMNTLRRGFYIQEKMRGSNYPCRLPVDQVLSIMAMMLLDGKTGSEMV